MTHHLDAPIDVIASLPYLCHFRPRRQLVLAAIHATGAGLGATPISLNTPDPIAEVSRALDSWPTYVERVTVCLYDDELAAHATDVLIADIIDLLTDRDIAIVDVLIANDRGWRSALCAADGCCTDTGHAFALEPPTAHGAGRVLDVAAETAPMWRRTMWGLWDDAIREAAAGCIADPELLMTLELSLHDIPLRDALLALAAQCPPDHLQGLRTLVAVMTSHALVGLAVPAWTCRGALEYLAGAYDQAEDTLRRVAAVAEYSLARLLLDGLRHRAPASLLTASFGHFDPSALLTQSAEAA